MGHSGGTWQFSKTRGTDGSFIFIDEQKGFALVINHDGQIFKGTFPFDFDIIGAYDFLPNYNALKLIEE